jgi:hypothetical protein
VTGYALPVAVLAAVSRIRFPLADEPVAKPLASLKARVTTAASTLVLAPVLLVPGLVPLVEDQMLMERGSSPRHSPMRIPF